MRSVTKKGQSGFSLLELLVVLFVATLTLLIGMPAFSRMLRELRAEGSVQEFAANVQLAKSEAVLRNQRVGVIVETSAHEYQLFRDMNSNNVPDSGEAITSRIPLHDGVQFASDAEKSNVRIAIFTAIGKLIAPPVSSDPVPSSYLALGPMITLIDQNGTEHSFRLHPNGLVEING
jgi:type IV fimbrial biogenesis protein FimT